jgi:hypothetical protein
MKKLFMVCGAGHFDTAYFDNKQLAKKCRDERQASGHNTCVSKGPDHVDFGIRRVNSTHPKKKGGESWKK